MMKSVLYLITIFFYSIQSFAQDNRAWANNLSYSVISRMIEVNKHSNLSSEKLAKIADLFLTEDSLVASSFKNGGNVVYIESLRKKTILEIKNVLTPKEFSQYTMALPGMVNVENFAKNLTRYYSQKYNLDSVIYYKKLFDQLKLQGSILTSQLNTVSVDQAGQYKDIINYYDNAAQKMLYEFEGVFICERNIDSLNRIQKMPDSLKLLLKSAFLKSTFLNKHYSYNEHFLNAMHSAITDTIYYTKMYKNDLTRRAEANAKREMIKLMKKVNVTSEGSVKIRQILFQHQRSLALYNLCFEKYTIQKDSLMTIVDNYYDSLLSIALMKDGHFKHNSLLSSAILYRKQLELRNTLTDTLIYNAQIVNRIWDDYESKETWARFDFAKYEAPLLEKLLTEDQYRLVLKIKNTPQAETWAHDDWIEIKKRGIDEAMDSSIAISMMKIYNTNMLVIKDRFAYDKEKMNNELNGLGVPPVLQRLKRARLTSVVSTDNNKTETKLGSQNLKDNFKW